MISSDTFSFYSHLCFGLPLLSSTLVNPVLQHLLLFDWSQQFVYKEKSCCLWMLITSMSHTGPTTLSMFSLITNLLFHCGFVPQKNIIQHHISVYYNEVNCTSVQGLLKKINILCLYRDLVIFKIKFQPLSIMMLFSYEQVLMVF